MFRAVRRSLLILTALGISCYAANAAKRHSRSKARSFRAWRRRVQSRRSEADSSLSPGGVAGRKAGQRPGRSLLTEWLSAVSCYAANAAKRHSRSKARSFRAWRRRERSRRSEADSSFQPGGVAGRKTGRRLRLCGGLFSVRKDHVRLSLPDAD